MIYIFKYPPWIIIVIVIMTQKINQLCKTIASHPSKINLLGEAIKIAFDTSRFQSFRPIIELLKSLDQGPEVIKFRDNKLQVIFTHIALKCLKNPEVEALGLLSMIFSISNQKDVLGQKIIDLISEKETQLVDWPANLMISIMEKLAHLNQSGNVEKIQLIMRFLIELPTFKELNLPEELQVPFKKSFQKLLITTLGNSSISKEIIHKIYHNLGDKVLSKLQNPLILSNSCLDRFANDSQLQIQVLSCIFLLVGKYGLQLEEFYPKLERLVRRRDNGYSIYELPNSRRFFKLLEAALRSSRVPFKTISTFAHLLIQQLPGEQSEFAFWSLSFIVNLTKKHRKLLDELPLIPELKVLKYHYNHKIRALVEQLSKNMNKIDYLQVEQFGMIDCKALNQEKMSSVIQSLQNDELQFKIPAFQDPV